MNEPTSIVRAALLILIFSVPVVAGEGALQGGRFTVFAGGREAGSEIVTVTVGEEALTIESRALLHRDDREQDLTLELVLDLKDGRIRSFSARGVQGEQERVVTLAAADGKLEGEIREGESARPISLPAEKGAIVLAEPFAAPYLLLLDRYDRERGGPQTFPVIYPLRGRSGSVTLTLREAQALEIDGQAVLADRILVNPDHGGEANLWIGSGGRLLVCARSVAGISAVRGKALRIGLKPGEDPPDPKSVVSFRIRLAGRGVTLAGTFTRPRKGPDRSPAALLISGSGPHDRNGNVPGAELQWNYLHAFAMALAEEGIATLRYDERGVGRSGGTFYGAGLSDLAADARSGLEYLASREDVDAERIAILGHSEGALIGAVLAGEESSPVRALVLLGAPAEPIDRILIGQAQRRLARRGTEKREAERIVGDMRAYFEYVRLSRTNNVTWQGRAREVRWLREHMAFSPIAAFKRIRVPVLVLHGERDAQVPSAQAGAIGDAMGKRAKVVVLPTLDHFLMPTRGELEGYGDAKRRVAPRALEEVGAFTRQILR